MPSATAKWRDYYEVGAGKLVTILFPSHLEHHIPDIVANISKTVGEEAGILGRDIAERIKVAFPWRASLDRRVVNTVLNDIQHECPDIRVTFTD